MIPIFIAALTSVAVGSRGELLAALKLGRLGRAEIAFVLLISATAALALLIWVWALEPDLSDFKAMLPSWSVPALVGAGIGFAVINAVLEEVIWRGIFQHWLLSVAPAAVAVVLQALSFGAAHYRGFPSGFVGVGLSTLYGLMLGALALRSRGLLAPIVAHVTADAVIFAIIASSVEAGA
ncbi:MAG: CPBP family intramembrane metalloprotease [Chthoniobacterales bacterium]|nr:CPBP family intramembrane metalloprotease [Chthoniobacterales bacterium]